MNKAVKKTDDWANFILRQIKQGVETNTILGGFYSYVKKDKNTEVFNELTKQWNEDDLKWCYAVITFFDESIMPLYENSIYYVMTDTGGTVAHLTQN